MDEKRDFTGIPQRRREENKPLSINIEESKLKQRLRDLIAEYGNALLEHIETDTGGTAPKAIRNWLSGRQILSPAIIRGIVSAINNLPESLIPLDNIPLPIIKQAPGAEPAPPKRKRAKNKTVEEIIAENQEKAKEFIKKHTQEQLNHQKPRMTDEEYNALYEKLKREGKIT